MDSLSFCFNFSMDKQTKENYFYSFFSIFFSLLFSFLNVFWEPNTELELFYRIQELNNEFLNLKIEGD